VVALSKEKLARTDIFTQLEHFRLERNYLRLSSWAFPVANSTAWNSLQDDLWNMDVSICTGIQLQLLFEDISVSEALVHVVHQTCYNHPPYKLTNNLLTYLLTTFTGSTEQV